VHFVIGVDIGGTCTDTVVVDETGHRAAREQKLREDPTAWLGILT
jgi:N-methylhydantoinase A/oxoprolinase/acetone carboxylase beta subunit